MQAFFSKSLFSKHFFLVGGAYLSFGRPALSLSRQGKQPFYTAAHTALF
jgi:hypothetical protein